MTTRVGTLLDDVFGIHEYLPTYEDARDKEKCSRKQVVELFSRFLFSFFWKKRK